MNQSRNSKIYLRQSIRKSYVVTSNTRQFIRDSQFANSVSIRPSG